MDGSSDQNRLRRTSKSARGGVPDRKRQKVSFNSFCLFILPVLSHCARQYFPILPIRRGVPFGVKHELNRWRCYHFGLKTDGGGARPRACLNWKGCDRLRFSSGRSPRYSMYADSHIKHTLRSVPRICWTVSPTNPSMLVYRKAGIDVEKDAVVASRQRGGPWHRLLSL